jgi:diguanylate cyclase (GGDEF)-like protein
MSRLAGAAATKGFLTRHRWVPLLHGLALATLVAGLAGYLVGPDARVWVANGAWLSSAAVATAGVALAVRRSQGPARAGWGLLLAGCVAWLIGEAFWIGYALTGYPTSPNPADVCWLAFAVFAAAAVIRLGLSASGRRLSWLELAPLAAAACALVAALMWNDISSSSLPLAGELTALAYPVLYVIAAFVMLQSVVTGTIDVRANRGMTLVLAGLVLNAVAFVLWTPLLLDASYLTGAEAIDILWTAGMVLVGLGGATAQPVSAVANVEQMTNRRGAVLPSITFAVLALIQAILIVRDAPAAAELALCLGLVLSGAMLTVRASNLRREQLRLLAQLRRRERELSEVNARLSRESRSDALTGLGNRLKLDEDLESLASEAERNGRSYCLILCDLDRFKDYNDALGHQAGDEALRRVARLLDEETRGADRVYRYGGEELLLILPDQDRDEGVLVAERHRVRVEREALPHPENPGHGLVTFSAGVAAAAPGETARQVLRRADAALYRAKCDGRNRVEVAGRPLARPAGLAASAGS